MSGTHSGLLVLGPETPLRAKEQGHCGDGLSSSEVRHQAGDDLSGGHAPIPATMAPGGERQNSTRRDQGWGAQAHGATVQASRGLGRAWVNEEVKPSTLLAGSKPRPSPSLSFPPVQEEGE